MASDDLGEKHLGLDARRARFDSASKYGGYGGKSVVKAMPVKNIAVKGYSDIFLKIRRPTDDDGNMLVSAVDQEVQALLRTNDAGGGELDTGGHWFKLPLLLEEECVSKSTTRDRDCGNVIVTTYSLKGVAWMAPSEEERRKLLQRREGRLTLARGDGQGVFCRFVDSPSEEIPDKSLLDCHARLVASAAEGPCIPQQAKALQEDYTSCWCAPVSYGKNAWDAHLEVDLGADCRVTWVSTQGRFPPISGTDRDTGIRTIHEGHPAFRNWVKSYELSFRTESGQWVSLGEFKGNSDMVTEVPHKLLPVNQEPLRCRYLRFRPLRFEGLPGMRVGVYGERLDASAPAHGDAGEEAALSQSLLQYSICKVKEQANLRRAQVGWGLCRMGCGRCSGAGGCTRLGQRDWSKIMRLRQGELEEVRRLGGARKASSCLLEDDADDDLVTHVGDNGDARDTGGGTLSRSPTSPLAARKSSFSSTGRQPSIRFERSSSDPMLSRFCSSAADSCAVCVDLDLSDLDRELSETDPISSLDLDDWLVVSNEAPLGMPPLRPAAGPRGLPWSPAAGEGAVP